MVVPDSSNHAGIFFPWELLFPIKHYNSMGHLKCFDQKVVCVCELFSLIYEGGEKVLFHAPVYEIYYSVAVKGG